MSDKKEFTIKDVTDLIYKKAKEKLEAIEKAEKEGNDHKVEEVTLPEGQLIPKTKENADGMPEATGKTMEKANPADRTSAQMAGLKIPSQPKPPKANEKMIDSGASKAIKPPKMPGLGAGLKKFMEDRGEKLQKARVDEGKTDAQKRLSRVDSKGYHRSANKQSLDASQGPKIKGGHVEAAKEVAKENLERIKSTPKPDLGKAEKISEKEYKKKHSAIWKEAENLPREKAIKKLEEAKKLKSNFFKQGNAGKMPKPDLGKSEACPKDCSEKHEHKESK